jgi:hypothetical protein
MINRFQDYNLKVVSVSLVIPHKIIECSPVDIYQSINQSVIQERFLTTEVGPIVALNRVVM